MEMRGRGTSRAAAKGHTYAGAAAPWQERSGGHTAWWCGAPHGNKQRDTLVGLCHYTAAQRALAKATTSSEGVQAQCRLAFKFPQAAFRPAWRRLRPAPHCRATVTTLFKQHHINSRCAPARMRQFKMTAQAMQCAHSQMYSVRVVSPASSAAHSSSSPSCCGNGPQRWHATSAEL